MEESFSVFMMTQRAASQSNWKVNVMKTRFPSIAAALCLFCAMTLIGVSLAEQQSLDAGHTVQIYDLAVKSPTDRSRVDAYIATLAESPRGSGRYIVEGDIPMSRDEVVVYLASLSMPAAGGPHLPGELIVNQSGGANDYWRDRNMRALRYTIDERSFPDGPSVAFVREHLAAAARDWENACNDCGVTIRESTEQARGAAGVTFKVTYVEESTGVIASSFFPSSKPGDRVLRVFAPYFHGLSFDPTGVFRHELGHILGYRHEHIVGIPGCATEGSAWKMITPYTANSVMHYFCGGAGSFDLALRPTDIQGHQCLYRTGAPCSVVSAPSSNR
jgi:hypothetical protein